MAIFWPAQTPASRRAAAAALGLLVGPRYGGQGLGSVKTRLGDVIPDGAKAFDLAEKFSFPDDLSVELKKGIFPGKKLRGYTSAERDRNPTKSFSKESENKALKDLYKINETIRGEYEVRKDTNWNKRPDPLFLGHTDRPRGGEGGVVSDYNWEIIVGTQTWAQYIYALFGPGSVRDLDLVYHMHLLAVAASRDGASALPYVKAYIAAVNVIYNIIPTFKKFVGRDPSDAEIKSIYENQRDSKDWSSGTLDTKIRQMAESIKEADANTAKTDRTKKVDALTKKLTDAYNKVVEQGKKVATRAGVTYGGPESVSSSSGTISTDFGSGLQLFATNFTKLNGIGFSARNTTQSAQLLGLGLSFKNPFDRTKFASNVTTPNIAVVKTDTVTTADLPTATALAWVATKEAKRLFDEISGQIDMVKDAPAAVFDPAAKIQEGKISLIQAQETVVKAAYDRVNALMSANEADLAKQKAAADEVARKAKEEEDRIKRDQEAFESEERRKQKSFDDEQARLARQDELAKAKAAFSIMDDKQLRAQYNALKLDPNADPEVVSQLLSVAAGRGIDLLKAALPYGMIAVGVGGLAIMGILIARRRSA